MRRMTTFYGQAIKRRSGWFFQVTKIIGPEASNFHRNDVLLDYGSYSIIGRPTSTLQALKTKTRRELRDAVRKYNEVQEGYRIRGGLH